MKIVLPLLIFSCVAFHLSGQSADSYETVAKLIADYQYQEADDQLQKMADSLKADLRYAKYDAQIARAKGDVERARSAYRLWLENDSSSIAAKTAWAQLESSQQNYKEAGDLYLKLIEQDPNNPHFHKLLAYLELKRESPIGALGAFYRSLELEDANQEVAAQVIRLSMEIKNFPAADSLLTIYLNRHPYSRIFLQLDLASAFSQKRYERLIQRGTVLLDSLQDSSLLTLKRLGIAHYHQQSWESAEALLLKALQKSEEQEQLFYYLGMLKSQQGLEQEARAYLKKAIEAGTSESLPVYHLNLALSWDAEAHYAEAIPYYQLAWEETQSPLILYYLARAYDEYYREKKTAESHYERFLDEVGDQYYEYQDFSRKRLAELKRIRHFRGE